MGGVLRCGSFENGLENRKKRKIVGRQDYEATDNENRFNLTYLHLWSTGWQWSESMESISNSSRQLHR
jgi:hypothetical protein